MKMSRMIHDFKFVTAILAVMVGFSVMKLQADSVNVDSSTTNPDSVDIVLAEDRTYDFLDNTNYHLSGVISGDYGLTKDGMEGTLILSNDNTYEGTSTINGGTLQIGNGDATGSVSGPIDIGANTLVFFRSDNSVTLDDLTVSNTISGTGSIVFRGTGVTNQSSYKFKGNSSTFSGQVEVGNGARLILEGSVSAASNAITVQNGGSVYLASNHTYHNPVTITGNGWTENPAGRQLGALRLSTNANLAGAVTLAGNARITAWNSNEFGTVSGNISDNGNGYSVETTGTGILTFSGNNTYTGGTFVSSGMLLLNGGSLAGDVHVDSNATFGGTTGAVTGNLTVQSGGAFTGNINTTDQYEGVTFTGNGDFKSGSYFTLTGNLTDQSNYKIFNGFVDVDLANAALAAGTPMFQLTALADGSIFVGVRPVASISDLFVNTLVMHNPNAIRNAIRWKEYDHTSTVQSTSLHRGQSPEARYGLGLFDTNSIWVNYVGRSNRLESNFYAGQQARLESGGVQLGVDLLTSQNGQLGMLFGYEDEHQHLGDSGDRINGDDYYFGLYGTRFFRNQMDLRGYIGYGHQNYDLIRYDNLGLHQAIFNGDTFEATLELGRQIDFSRCFSLRPLIAVDFFNNDLDETMEDNQGVGYSNTSLTQLFFRSGATVNRRCCRLNLNGMMSYSYQANSSGDTLQTLVTSNGVSRWAYGGDLGNLIITLGTGADYALNRCGSFRLFANYYADLYTDRDGSPAQHTAMIGLQKRF